MIEYIKGEIKQLTPTFAVLDKAGIGFYLQISLNTFTELQNLQECTLFVHEVIREDAYLLYGFHGSEEREAFRKLINVTGIGANTARMILSSLTVAELESCIISENIHTLKSIKGIGLKTAQRLIVELKDKVIRSGMSGGEVSPASVAGNQVRQEALAALQMLGFTPSQSSKAVNTVLKEFPTLPVEQLIKAALKIL
ncbi:MAG: Holliday junction branch migration protein RuvA [Bacteroidales bacterium]|jgi:Holliday junction DNA helicase RuvA|nr:Holliday junction branch migration protein RuvA [Bacteroidales bacterium]MDI9544334.1 Holliday junction branch migration protein RuvA [Bacteroidota bacterium]NLV37757.1 Holliday junction branch migration protein RuvA [Bacteroidales bacterium]HOD26959.1 Holliday junction branch migration protein RuvA [Bacteroidales bacterium]HOH25302.1 Holliday junction branch migration protein RuvA [Bacteroidales bacterium]